MGRYILGRVAVMLPTLLCLTVAAFFLTTAARGDPAEIALPFLSFQVRTLVGLRILAEDN